MIPTDQRAKMDEDCDKFVEIMKSSISLVCRSAINSKNVVKVEGLLGVTLDDQQILLVNVNELFALTPAGSERKPKKTKGAVGGKSSPSRKPQPRRSKKYQTSDAESAGEQEEHEEVKEEDGGGEETADWTMDQDGMDTTVDTSRTHILLTEEEYSQFTHIDSPVKSQPSTSQGPIPLPTDVKGLTDGLEKWEDQMAEPEIQFIEQEIETQEGMDSSIQTNQLFFCEFCGQTFTALENFYVHKEFNCGKKENRSTTGQTQKEDRSTAGQIQRKEDRSTTGQTQKEDRSTTEQTQLQSNGEHDENKPIPQIQVKPFEGCSQNKDGSTLVQSPLETVTRPGRKSSQLPLELEKMLQEKMLEEDLDFPPSEEDKEKPFKCDVCPRAYKSMQLLQTHNLKYHKTSSEVQYSCLICCRKMRCEQNVMFHFKSVHQISHPVCTLCALTLKSDTEFEQHMLATHCCQEQVSCMQCFQTFKTHTELNQHLSTVHACDDADSTMCRVCNKVLANKQCLRIHMRDLHNPTMDYSFKCSRCKLSYKTKRNLQRHVIQKHGKASEVHTCQLCNKRFRSLAGYKYHCQLHKGTFRYQCHVCAEKFLSKASLEGHLNKHSDTKPYSCVTCGAEFHYKQTRDAHEKKHQAKDEKVTCDICQVECKGRKQLKLHKARTHPQTLFTCELCQAMFKRKDSLDNHKKNVHMEQAWAQQFNVQQILLVEQPSIEEELEAAQYQDEEEFQ